jgi:hypothetical protein
MGRLQLSRSRTSEFCQVAEPSALGWPGAHTFVSTSERHPLARIVSHELSLIAWAHAGLRRGNAVVDLRRAERVASQGVTDVAHADDVEVSLS